MAWDPQTFETGVIRRILKKLMKITCITTVFNDGEALFNSVNSILNQTHQDFQYIIVDDGSDKETIALIDGIDDPRVLVLHQANDGLSGARNKALEQVKGDYVCFLDADDTRPGWFFQNALDIIEAEAPDVIFCRGILSEVRGDLLDFYDSGKFREILGLLDGAISVESGAPEFEKTLALAQLIEPQSANKVVRTALLRDNFIGFPNTHFFEDIYFHTRLLSAAQKLAFLETPSFTYFRRYQRPQITSATSDLRFDIIPVTKLTMEMFATTDRFHDPVHRAAVTYACFKIIQWCETSVSHHLRYAFRQSLRGLVMLIDPLMFHFPAEMPPGMEDVATIRNYIETIRNG